MKDERHTALRQHSEKAAPTVMHHPEEKETVLAGWLRRRLEQGPTFWVVLAAIVVGTILVVVLFTTTYGGHSPEQQAWTELALAQTPEQQERVAHDHPGTKAAHWALLAAASSVYDEGFKQLTTSRDAASPFLKRAYNLYSDLQKETEKSDPLVARMAALGMARSLEATGDLGRAEEQYKLVVSTWPGTEEAKEAEKYAKRLGTTEAVEFYKWLASYKAPEAKLPPAGQSLPDIFGPAGGSITLPPGGSSVLGDLPALPDNVFPDASKSAPETKAPPAAPPDSGVTKPAEAPPAAPTPAPAAKDGAARP